MLEIGGGTLAFEGDRRGRLPLLGSFKHYQLGNVDWRVALSLAPAAILGSYAGAWITASVSSSSLKRAFGGLLIFAGARLLIGK